MTNKKVKVMERQVLIPELVVGPEISSDENKLNVAARAISEFIVKPYRENLERTIKEALQAYHQRELLIDDINEPGQERTIDLDLMRGAFAINLSPPKSRSRSRTKSSKKKRATRSTRSIDDDEWEEQKAKDSLWDDSDDYAGLCIC